MSTSHLIDLDAPVHRTDGRGRLSRRDGLRAMLAAAGAIVLIGRSADLHGVLSPVDAPPVGSFAGAIPGTPILLLVAVDSTRSVIAHASDGGPTAVWFSGRAQGSRISLPGTTAGHPTATPGHPGATAGLPGATAGLARANGDPPSAGRPAATAGPPTAGPPTAGPPSVRLPGAAAVLAARVTPGRVAGELTLGGVAHPFTLAPVGRTGGLYVAQGADTRATWIVLPDGTQRGTMRTGDSMRPAPRLGSTQDAMITTSGHLLRPVRLDQLSRKWGRFAANHAAYDESRAPD